MPSAEGASPNFSGEGYSPWRRRFRCPAFSSLPLHGWTFFRPHFLLLVRVLLAHMEKRIGEHFIQPVGVRLAGPPALLHQHTVEVAAGESPEDILRHTHVEALFEPPPAKQEPHMVFLPVSVAAPDFVQNAGQLRIEHPRPAQQIEDGVL